MKGGKKIYILLMISISTLVGILSGCTEEETPEELDASFTYTPTENIYINDEITFTGVAEGGTTPYTYYWDFGEGNSSTEQNPKYNYTKIGEYNVNLSVTDSDGSTDYYTVTITVEYEPPKAMFEYTPTTGINTTTEITFNATTSTKGDYNISTYDWDFGDGNTSNESATVTHTYAVADTYTVVLTVTDEYGLTDTETKDIIVAEEN